MSNRRADPRKQPDTLDRHALFLQAVRRIERRLLTLPVDEATGSVTIHLSRGIVKKVEWRTLDDAEGWDVDVA